MEQPHDILPARELQPTRQGFCRIFDRYRKEGLTMKEAYYATTDWFEAREYQTLYSSFESFEQAYYRQVRQEAGKAGAA